MPLLFGGIEAGGTKFVCVIGDENNKILKKLIIPTDVPDITFPKVIDFFKSLNSKDTLTAIGIGSFGPIELNKQSPYFGYITNTPRMGWKNFNFIGKMREEFNIPFGFDTDVNIAALGEHCAGAARDLDTFIYITVGTGIGMGGMVSNNLMHGLVHPEMGHIIIPRHNNDNFIGTCQLHKNCLSGLASGLSMQKRWGVSAASDLHPDHLAWDIEADYLSIAIVNCSLILSPQKIILDGGVIKNSPLLSKIHSKVLNLLNGYIKHEKILAHIEDYIVMPILGDDAGAIGALNLAKNCYFKNHE